MGCESGVGVLRGGGKVTAVGGRSGSFSPRAGYEGRRGAMRNSGPGECHAELRSSGIKFAISKRRIPRS
jgi:hypothetical protein